MPPLALIFAGAGATLLACYSTGLAIFGSLRVPQTVRFAIGSAIFSHAVFLLLIVGGARDRHVLALLAVALIPLAWRPPKLLLSSRTFSSPWMWPLGLIGAVYAVVYSVHALAPSIEPDAITYHLGLVRRWLYHDSFSDQISFYETLPQGLEMLFFPAYMLGQHSAAKLVHFGFLVATIPLLFATGKRLGLERWQVGGAAVLYACAPVTGLTGTSAYNDVAGVFFVLATFYLLLAWDEERDWRYVALAGLTAGFCYSIKVTGGLAPVLAFGFLIVRRKPKEAGILAAAAAFMIAPWMIRNLAWTGNPVAPLINALFENRFYHVATEQYLREWLLTYGVSTARLPLELTMWGGELQGLIGPVFLLGPLASLGLRRRNGRLLLLLTALLSIGWLLNHGARFFLPSLLFLALALAVALPRPAVIALALAQAVLSLPAVLDRYAAPNAQRLRGLPVEAALRLEAEEQYLGRVRWETSLAGLVQENVGANQRVLDLFGIPYAYCDATAVLPWQSAAADRMNAALEIGALTGRGVYTQLRGIWPAAELTALRFRLKEARDSDWSIHEVSVLSNGRKTPPTEMWTLSAWPRIWEAPLAIDGNPISKWAAWERSREGMFLQLNFGKATETDGATLTVPTGEQQMAVEFLGRGVDGKWRRLSATPYRMPSQITDWRRSAMQVLKREGVSFILSPSTNSPYAKIGQDLLDNPAEWGVEAIGKQRAVHLFRIR